VRSSGVFILPQAVFGYIRSGPTLRLRYVPVACAYPGDRGYRRRVRGFVLDLLGLSCPLDGLSFVVFLYPGACSCIRVKVP